MTAAWQAERLRLEAELGAGVTVDGLTGGGAGWCIAQRKGGHRHSADDVLTAWYALQVAPGVTEHLDLGAGIGTVGLLTLWGLGAEARLTCVEAQEMSFRLLRANVECNGLAERVEARLGDLRELALGRKFPLVTGSPPYFPPGSGIVPDDPQKAHARFELRGNVGDYAQAAARHLAPGGWFVLCFPSAQKRRAVDLISAAGLRVARCRDVIPRASLAPLFTLFACQHAAEGDGPPVEEAAFVVREEDGRRTADMAAVRRGFGFCGDERWTIVGQGLAGTCVAWELWKRGAAFRVVDRGAGGSSRIAAGMVNPVTGKNFGVSWRIGEFLPEALAFYAAVERQVGRKLWHALPVLRLAETAAERAKISAKLAAPEVAPWVAGEVTAPPGWAGAVELRGGGRLDVRAFVESSREFFAGRVETREFSPDEGGERVIRCDGAEGLATGRHGPHRCAKGEILTLRAAGWDESRIRIGAGGWLVPLGGGHFKVGSTYEWTVLDEVPTAAGRARLAALARTLGGSAEFEIVAHEAGVRPILRRSEPVIGPVAGGGWMCNGLGSKGALYAPGMAARLARWLLDGTEPEPEVDYRHFRQHAGGDGR